MLIAGDVFIYVGPLEASFAEAARALRPGGLFAFSVEAPSDDELRRPQPVLRDSGRWAHAAAYVRELAAAHGFHEERCEDVMIRAGQAGFLFAFGRK